MECGTKSLLRRLYVTSGVPETWKSRHLQLRCANMTSSTTSAVLPRNVQSNTEAPQRKGQHWISAGFVTLQATQLVLAQLSREIILPRQRRLLRHQGLYHLLLPKRCEYQVTTPGPIPYPDPISECNHTPNPNHSRYNAI